MFLSIPWLENVSYCGRLKEPTSIVIEYHYLPLKWGKKLHHTKLILQNQVKCESKQKKIVKIDNLKENKNN